MTKVNQILDILNRAYPEAKCSLRFNSSLELLIATILSAQCTDERVNRVTNNLFKKYKSVSDYANANLDEFQEDIRSTGFYRNKAKNIILACQRILSNFGGEVPKNMDDLISLPGVARKTANVVLGNAFSMAEGIVVDTHVSRLSKRLAWTKETNTDKIEQSLIKIIPKDMWINISHILILHGRAICRARKPKCEECILQSECPSIGI